MMYILYIVYMCYCALVCSAWYLVPACNSSYAWNLPLAIRAHATTKLHELTMALHTSRGGWMCKYRASTDAVALEIGDALVACEG